jgi:SAM-dependent methyltransferase
VVSWAAASGEVAVAMSRRVSASITHVNVGLEETLAFVTSRLPSRTRILEVGCGSGALARALVARGHEVVGIDRSEKAVKSARRAGFEALRVDFLEFEDEPFDAVLFTRSLHHIHELERAVERAHGLLVPGGLLLADEFALERMNRKTASWLRDQRRLLAAADVVAARREDGGPLETWRSEHAHVPPLHPAKDMLAALRRRFGRVTAERAPYLYRYFCEELDGTPRSESVGRALLEAEARLVRERALVAIGLRVCAKRTRG